MRGLIGSLFDHDYTVIILETQPSFNYIIIVKPCRHNYVALKQPQINGIKSNDLNASHILSTNYIYICVVKIGFGLLADFFTGGILNSERIKLKD